MSVSILLIILLAAVLHAVWNALLKSQIDRTLGLCVQLIAATVFSLVVLCFIGLPKWTIWMFIIPSTLLHLFYHLLLLQAYRLADMNLAYPILRGSAPLFAAVFALVALGEVPSLVSAVGILTICTGIALLARGASLRGVLVALATATVIAAYSVVDAAGARTNADGFQYAVFLMMLDAAAFLPIAVRQRGWRALARLDTASYIKGIIGGICAVTAYGLVVIAYTQTTVATVAALRETSIIIGALLGYYFLGEKHGLRIPYALVIMVGVMLVIFGKKTVGA